jgi:hypothetical protein
MFSIGHSLSNESPVLAVVGPDLGGTLFIVESMRPTLLGFQGRYIPVLF